MLQINNSIRELLHKKRGCEGYPDFLVYILSKTKYHSAGTRSMLRGLQRYGNDLDFLVEGSLEVKLPTIWTDEKQSKAERRERLEERRVEEKESEERRCRCAKRQKSRETLCFSNDLGLRRIEK